MLNLKTSSVLFGIGASTGFSKGPARIINNSNDILQVDPGDIIVARDATPYLLPALLVAAGAICERGGLTCHLAVLSRELAKPCVVGVRQARITLDGYYVMIDGTTGEINIYPHYK